LTEYLSTISELSRIN